MIWFFYLFVFLFCISCLFGLMAILSDIAAMHHKLDELLKRKDK